MGFFHFALGALPQLWWFFFPSKMPVENGSSQADKQPANKTGSSAAQGKKRKKKKKEKTVLQRPSESATQGAKIMMKPGDKESELLPKRVSPGK